MACRVGVDIGGTFTDFALLDEETSRLIIHKRLTTPVDPARAVLDGLPELLSRADVPMEDIAVFVHGTTLVTNALIERSGAVTGMLCTNGFADVLDIAMERRYDMYDLRITYPKPLVPRRLRAEIDERIAADGSITRALDAQEVRDAVGALIDRHRIEALAVCFLNSPVNPAHENAVRDIVASEYPGLSLATSADVFPFLREYERWSTTTMNAYTQPMFAAYLVGLEQGLAGLGFAGDFYIMTSSGGTVTPETARRYPIRILESGPATGVLMSAALGRRRGHPEVLAFDMGGTTAKGALVRGHAPLKRYDMEVARVHEFKVGSGLPAKIPVIDLIEIGAGGGSIADVDIRGAIRVGPRSAGAAPGPACYGLGGQRATLTDANLVLGYLSADYFLGGEMALNGDAAHRAIADDIAERLGIEAVRAAWGVHETASEDISRAFRNHASERGFDYRRAVMIVFGGCGPMHALRVARKLRVPTVIVPAGSGVMSSVGLLASPLAFELLKSRRVSCDDLDAELFDDLFSGLHDHEARHLPATIEHGRIVHRWLDMRYRGQGYDVEVALPDQPTPEVIRHLPTLFAEAYARVFARAIPDEPIEIVSWKIEVAAASLEDIADYRMPTTSIQNSIKNRRLAYDPNAADFADWPVYDRYALAAGEMFVGPALVEERESTCVIGAGDRVVVDDDASLVIDVAMTAP